MRLRTAAAIAASALLPAVQALAQPGPPAAPTRDVAVTYRNQDDGKTKELGIRWSVAEGRMRIDTPEGAFIRDLRANKDILLMTQQRMFLEGKVGSKTGTGLDLVKPGDTVRREGTDRVAGQDCTIWRIEAKKEDPEDEAEVKRACVTADGVPLRVVETEGGEQGRTTIATRVEYGRQDPALFRVPEGYRPFDASAFAPQQQRR
jgi:hypothetical protein